MAVRYPCQDALAWRLHHTARMLDLDMTTTFESCHVAVTWSPSAERSQWMSWDMAPPGIEGCQGEGDDAAACRYIRAMAAAQSCARRQ